MKQSTLWLARTAMLLALCVLFQSIRIFFPALSLVKIPLMGDLSLLLIGTLVNLVLYVAVGTVGIYGALVICVLAPIISLFQGHIPFPQMVLVVAFGNGILAFVFWLFIKKKSHLFMIGGIIVASLAKFVVLFLSVTKIIIPMLVNIKEVQSLASTKNAPVSDVAKALSAALSANFSLPQLFTALLGGFLAIAVISAIRKANLIR